MKYEILGAVAAAMFCANIYAADASFGDHTDGVYASITGAESPWNADVLYVGRGGNSNALSIHDAGSATSSGAFIGRGSTPNDFGSDSASDNQISVSGTNSTWTTGSLIVGQGFGTGNQLLITSGGTVIAGQSSVGRYNFNGSNQVVVSGTDSSFTVQALTVGYRSDGNDIHVSNGGKVSATDATIGYSDGIFYSGNGNQMTVNGAGSRFSSDTLNVGGLRASNNGLVISDGGVVVTKTANIGASGYSYPPDNNAVVVSGDGARWENENTIHIGNYDEFGNVSIGSGNQLTVEQGGVVVARGGVVIQGDNDLYLNEDGYLWIGTDFDASQGFHYSADSALRVDGQLSGISVLQASRTLEAVDVLGNLTIDGTFAPGSRLGGAVIQGDLILGAGGVLDMVLGGDEQGLLYDSLDIDGNFSADGTLAVSLLDDFSPAMGDSFTLFEWQGGFDGTFSTISLSPLQDSLSWDVSQLYTTGTIGVVPEPSSLALIVCATGLLYFKMRILGSR